MTYFTQKNILVTGGSGSFGKQFIKTLLEQHQPARVIVFSRDELKQHEMRQAGFASPILRYFIGDVRDRDRLRRAFNGVDVVVHAAALKQVPACEYNPDEAIKTNILGTSNVIEAAIDAGVKRVLALSTDKAVNPVNLYGATKLAAEKLVVQSNAYAASHVTRLSCVRYGNVVGSRGSVVPVFLEQRKHGSLTITDERMTRFWITLAQGVQFVMDCIEVMQGGEVFVPKIPSMKITDLAKAIAPDAAIKVVGIRPGEKLHEALISDDEARTTIELETMYVVQPAEAFWFGHTWDGQGTKLPEGFRYTSDNNNDWLSIDSLNKILKTTSKERKSKS